MGLFSETVFVLMDDGYGGTFSGWEPTGVAVRHESEARKWIAEAHGSRSYERVTVVKGCAEVEKHQRAERERLERKRKAQDAKDEKKRRKEQLREARKFEKATNGKPLPTMRDEDADLFFDTISIRWTKPNKKFSERELELLGGEAGIKKTSVLSENNVDKPPDTR